MTTEPRPLTPKQQRFVDEKRLEGMAALRLLCRHIGMLPLTPGRAAQTRAMVSDDFLAGIIFCVVVPEIMTPAGRAACALMLDLVSPDWREVAGPEILGPLVERDSPEVREWRASVLARDEFTCRKCGSNENLHAHHVVRWADAPELRIEVSNGLTVCRDCHVGIHRLQ